MNEIQQIRALAVYLHQENLVRINELFSEIYQESHLIQLPFGSELVPWITSNSPDLLLIDCLETETFGFELVEQMKLDVYLKDIPIIIIFPRDCDRNLKTTAYLHGVDFLLQDTIDASDLKFILKNMLKIKKANFDSKSEKNRLSVLINEQNNEISKTHLAALNLLEDLQNEIETRKGTEFALRESEEKLKLSSVEKDKFFSIIAHDLKGPINGFLALTQMISDELPGLSIDEIKKAIISMRNSAANLFRLLENLLQWSKIMQGNIQFNPRIIQIKPFVEDCISVIIEQAKNKSIRVLVNIPEDLEVTADGNMLQSVIRNLISNSIKFTLPGGIVTITAHKSDNKTVQFSIKDSGIGMNQDLISKLFLMNENKKRKGTSGESSTGLGLILCKEFIDKHKGEIWAESVEGAGSTFHFTLPIF